MPDADAASGFICAVSALSQARTTDRRHRDQEGKRTKGSRRRIERKERMRTIGHKSRVWPTIGGHRDADGVLGPGHGRRKVPRSRPCSRPRSSRAGCREAGRETRRVHRRGAVHRMPRPGEQAFQRDAACEGLPAEPEERRVSGRVAKPATDRARITPGTRSTRPRSSGSPSAGARRWRCRMPSA